MKKNVIKTAIAAVCVVAAGYGGMKAYNAANQSETDLLLAENVEALTVGDVLPTASGFWDCCYPANPSDQCYAYYYNSSEGLVQGSYYGYKNN